MPEKTDAKSGRTYIEARYKPPVEAYSQWPGLLPQYITKRFPVGFETEAEKWLNDAERAIRLGVWKPPRAEETELCVCLGHACAIWNASAQFGKSSARLRRLHGGPLFKTYAPLEITQLSNPVFPTILLMHINRV